MADLARQVRRFYELLWNRRELALLPELLHEDVRFRGSLGTEVVGRAGFVAYLEEVHRALGAYRCIVEDLLCAPPKAFARMRFEGVHRGELMGHAPTGRPVSWAGAALFTFEGERIRDLWVLGDLKSLERQLAGG